jgi:16S rRNA (uracil1498-N3)-methyltransferase
MTRRRWIADQVAGSRAMLLGEHAQHLARVLRARVGQEFDIATESKIYRGRIISIADDRVEFDLGDEIPAPTVHSVTLAISVFKFDRMEWAIEKCTELGLARIVPVIAHRTEAHLAAAATKRVERWQRVARQASEQARRVLPPEISLPIKFKAATSLPGGVRIVLSEVEADVMLKDIVRSWNGEGEVVLALGPEGGWTEAELKLFQEAGWRSASLGDTILRAETAAIAGLAVVLAELVE